MLTRVVDQRGPIYRSTENRDLVLSAARSRGFAFAPPATAVHPGAATALFVKDSTGQQLAYVPNEDEPGRRSAAKLLTKDEARRIAVNIANLPYLVR